MDYNVFHFPEYFLPKMQEILWTLSFSFVSSLLIWHKEMTGLQISANHSLCSTIFTSRQKCIRFLMTSLTHFFLSKNIHIKFQGTRTKTRHKHHQIKPRHSSVSIGHRFPMSSIHHPGQTLVFSKFPASQEQWQGLFCRKNPPSRHRKFRYLDKPLDYIWNANSLYYRLLAMWKQYVALTK